MKRTSSPLTAAGAWARPPAAGVAAGEDQTLFEAVEELERGLIAETLRRHSGNISQAARVLGLTRRGLQLKLSRYRMRAKG